MTTPIERRGRVWVKRDDLFEAAGVRGGKVRAALAIATEDPPPRGLVTAGARQSPQVLIVARIGAMLGLPVVAHVPYGRLTPELEAARDAGAELMRWKPGRNTVIVARARQDAALRGWRLVPFGMDCDRAVEATAGEVGPVPPGTRRLVVPVGSGISLAGILRGLDRTEQGDLKVVGVVVGADPRGRLDRHYPLWRFRPLELVEAGVPYEERVSAALEGLSLDPVYEAKCLPFLRPDDLFWIVGRRPERPAASAQGLLQGGLTSPGR